MRPSKNESRHSSNHGVSPRAVGTVGVTTATAFLSQSVMTLAAAGAGVPTAIQAPSMAAETEQLTA